MIRAVLALICLALVALMSWALVETGLQPDRVVGGGPGGKIIVCMIFGVPFWLLLAGAYASGVAGGGLDWSGFGRGWQHLAVFLVATCSAVAMVLAAALYTEPTSQLPWVYRPIIGWAMWGIPVLAIASGLFALSNLLPPIAVQGTQITTGALVFAICAGLLMETIILSLEDEAVDTRGRLADAVDRDRRFLAQIQSADPVRDFGSLLRHSGRYSEPVTRNLALEKIRLNPNLTDNLITSLGDERRDDAMTFVAWNDPPEPSRIAPAVRDAINNIANHAHEEIREGRQLWGDYFDARCERAIAAADRLTGLGVDFVPSIKALRDALDESSSQKINPKCRRDLNSWLDAMMRNTVGSKK